MPLRALAGDPFAPTLRRLDGDPFAAVRPSTNDLETRVSQYQDSAPLYERAYRTLERGFYNAVGTFRGANAMGAADIIESLDAYEQEADPTERAKINTGRLSSFPPRQLEDPTFRAKLREKMAGELKSGVESYLENQAKAEKVPRNPALDEAMRGSFWEGLKADPLGVIGGLTGESAPMMAPALIAGPLGVSTAALTAGVNSYAAEYVPEVMDSFRQAGVDVSNPEAVANAINDPQKMAEARAHANKKAVPVALFDALSFGIASRYLGPGKMRGTLAGELLNVGGQTVGGGALGGAGEVAGQVAQTGEVRDWNAVLAEVAGEAGMAPVEVASTLASRPKVEISPEVRATLTQDDIDSPISNDIILEGRQILKDAEEGKPLLPEGAVSADVLFPAEATPQPLPETLPEDRARPAETILPPVEPEAPQPAQPPLPVDVAPQPPAAASPAPAAPLPVPEQAVSPDGGPAPAVETPPVPTLRPLAAPPADIAPVETPPRVEVAAPSNMNAVGASPPAIPLTPPAAGPERQAFYTLRSADGDFARAIKDAGNAMNPGEVRAVLESWQASLPREAEAPRASVTREPAPAVPANTTDAGSFSDAQLRDANLKLPKGYELKREGAVLSLFKDGYAVGNVPPDAASVQKEIAFRRKDDPKGKMVPAGLARAPEVDQAKAPDLYYPPSKKPFTSEANARLWRDRKPKKGETDLRGQGWYPVKVEGGYALKQRKAISAGRQQTQTGPVDVLTFLASKGGVKNESGELQDLQRFTRRGNVVRKNGLSLDYAREALVEDGYLPANATTSDVVEILRKAMGSKAKIYKPDQAAPTGPDEGEAIARDDIKALAKEKGMEWFGESDVGLVVDLMTAENMDAETALEAYAERLAIQSEAEVAEVEDDGIPIEQTGPRRDEGADAGRAGEPQSTGERQDQGAQSPANLESPRQEARVEQTKEGAQFVLPGAEKISDRELAERKMQGPLKSTVPQSNTEGLGLFDKDARPQAQMFDAPKAEEATPAAFPEVKRFEIGRSLTPAQRKKVMSTLQDVYRTRGGVKEFKGTDARGNERYGWASMPELFDVSDITGRAIRFVVYLPDGRKAHPTELFPAMTESSIERRLSEEESKRKNKEAQDKSRLKALEGRMGNSPREAVTALRVQGIFNAGPDDTVMLTNGEKYVHSSTGWVEGDLALLGEGWKIAGDGARGFINLFGPRDPNAPPMSQQFQQDVEAAKLFATQPVDRAMRIPFDIFGGVDAKGEWKPGAKLFAKARNAITNATFDEDGRFGFVNGFLTRARAGLLDRYGLDEDYVARERKRTLDERKILARVPELLETLKSNNIGPQEAKVLQAVLTGEEVGTADMEALAEPIRKAIDELGAEAVQLGLLSAESFERNRGKYLHRVYLKHEADQNALTGFVAKLAGNRRKKIMGDQFKGRGMFLEAAPGNVLRNTGDARTALDANRELKALESRREDLLRRREIVEVRGEERTDETEANMKRRLDVRDRASKPEDVLKARESKAKLEARKQSLERRREIISARGDERSAESKEAMKRRLGTRDSAEVDQGELLGGRKTKPSSFQKGQAREQGVAMARLRDKTEAAEESLAKVDGQIAEIDQALAREQAIIDGGGTGEKVAAPDAFQKGQVREQGASLNRLLAKSERARLATQKIDGQLAKLEEQWVREWGRLIETTGVKPTEGGKFEVYDNVVDGKMRGRVFVPAGETPPATVAGWTERGTWEIRGTKRGKVVLWRDYTKQERTQMGEIMDARYTIAKTYMLMAHDLATGRFYKDISQNADWTSDTEPQGLWKDAADYNGSLAKRLAGAPDVKWVKVPDTEIPKSQTKRYGALAGKFVRAEIWRDITELEVLNTPNWWDTLMRQWKLNKTARNPVVHMNNVMSNVVLMDLADVRAVDLARGVASLVKRDAMYTEALENGALGSDVVAADIKENVLAPILEDLQRQAQGGQGSMQASFGTIGKLADRIWTVGNRVDEKMLEMYRLEDEAYRMALFIRLRDKGFSAELAANEARAQFLDYDIRAPWVNIAKRTGLPFISYTYRAVPLLARAIATKPWKIAKYAAIAWAANAIGYALMDGDEDEERRSLRPEEQGTTWFGAPRMIRMPWGDDQGNPVFLDIRRWIPAGDIFDTNMGSLALPLPAPLHFGGPIALAAEFYLNKQAFTGKEITNEYTDDLWDKTAKVGDWAWKSWAPAAPWVPGSWYWQKIENAISGARDATGRPYDVMSAVASSVGVKLKPQDVEQGMYFHGLEYDRIERALRAEMRTLAKDYERGLISEKAYNAKTEKLFEKFGRLEEKRNQTLTGEAAE